MTTLEQTVNNLRTLADWFEKHPDVPIPWAFMGESVFYRSLTDDPDERSKEIRAIGSANKVFQNNEFHLEVKIGNYTLIFWTSRENVCTKKIVGQKLIEKRIEPEKVIPEHYEDIVEWECSESILAYKEKENNSDNA